MNGKVKDEFRRWYNTADSWYWEEVFNWFMRDCLLAEIATEKETCALIIENKNDVISEQKSRISSLEADLANAQLAFIKADNKAEELEVELAEAKEVARKWIAELEFKVEYFSKQAQFNSETSDSLRGKIKELEAERDELKEEVTFQKQLVKNRIEVIAELGKELEIALDKVAELEKHLQESDSRAKETAISFGIWWGDQLRNNKITFKGMTNEQVFTKYQDSLKEKT